MNDRLYLIANAPTTPAVWFHVVMPTSRPLPLFKGLDGNTYVSWKAAEDACGYDNYTIENIKLMDAWDEEYTKQRDVQWPIVWADAILERLYPK